MSNTITTTDGTKLFFSIEGPVEADVVCLSHCFGSNHRYWDFHLPALEGLRVLRYDTRGHGNSACPPGPYSLKRLAQDVVELLDELSIDRVHFVGVSMGGMTGQTLALEHADRVGSLTIANSPCHYRDEQIALWRERADAVLDHGIATVKPALMERWFTEQAATQRLPGYVFMDRAIDQFTPACFAAAVEALCEIDTTERLHRIAVPTLLFGSADDPGVPVEVSRLMAARIPNAELHWLEPSRHLATLEQPVAFNTVLRTFLQTHANIG